MSAAIDRTRWARRPSPCTLDQIVDIAQRGGHRLRAWVRLPEGWGEVYLDGSRVLHAKVGWALGRRAMARLMAAQPFAEVHVQLHQSPELYTLPPPHAATPRLPEGTRGVTLWAKRPRH